MDRRVPGLHDLVPNVRDRRQKGAGPFYGVPGGQVIDNAAERLRLAGELQVERERLERLRLPTGGLPQSTRRDLEGMESVEASAAGRSWAKKLLGGSSAGTTRKTY
jgi:hypothetical protein